MTTEYGSRIIRNKKGEDMFEKIIYALSVALQMYGSLMLSFTFFKKLEYEDLATPYLIPCEPVDNYVEKYLSTLVPDKSETGKFVRRYIKTRISFIIIALGFVVSIFGNSNGLSHLEMIIYISICMIAIAIICELVTFLFEFLYKIKFRKEINKPRKNRNRISIQVTEFNDD